MCRVSAASEQTADKSAIPAIAVTGYYEKFPPAQLSGWAAYFRKPLQIEQLVETIAAILRRGCKPTHEGP